MITNLVGIIAGVNVLNLIKTSEVVPQGQEKLKLVVFSVLILSGILLESVVHLIFGITVVYTQFYYLIVAVAGLWYGRAAIATALFFGGLQIFISMVLEPHIIPYEPILRALILLIVAIVIWKLVEEIKRYHKQVLAKNRELTALNSQLDSTQKAFVNANKKLNLLSSITRHDIKNQLTALLAYIELSKMIDQSVEMKTNFDKEEIVANNILRQIEFTRTYEDIGVKAAQWNNIEQIIALISPILVRAGIELRILTGNLEIFADPLLEKVFENMVDNSIRHGEHVRQVTVKYEKSGSRLLLIYEDDGAGVPETDKKKIFEKGFGKNTGLGLFISREILSITGLSIRECGNFGSGVRFEIEIPDGCFRFGGKSIF
ncbi:MAG: HAMP domain-containing sensor histidine kinase [Methanoregula sp.]|uniref:sensor histidine kinase n=1 Tax=Methanoregula sp. TaxID=2052170 RepID=UPI003BB0CC85